MQPRIKNTEEYTLLKDSVHTSFTRIPPKHKEAKAHQPAQPIGKDKRLVWLAFLKEKLIEECASRPVDDEVWVYYQLFDSENSIEVFIVTGDWDFYADHAANATQREALTKADELEVNVFITNINRKHIAKIPELSGEFMQKDLVFSPQKSEPLG